MPSNPRSAAAARHWRTHEHLSLLTDWALLGKHREVHVFYCSSRLPSLSWLSRRPLLPPSVAHLPSRDVPCMYSVQVVRTINSISHFFPFHRVCTARGLFGFLLGCTPHGAVVVAVDGVPGRYRGPRSRSRSRSRMTLCSMEYPHTTQQIRSLPSLAPSPEAVGRWWVLAAGAARARPFPFPYRRHHVSPSGMSRISRRGGKG